MEGKSKGKKSVDEMSNEELGKFRHSPETELSILVTLAAQTEEYADLKDFLQVMSECGQDKKMINEQDQVGMTALHCAVACSNLPTVILLLKYGTNVETKDKLGFTPLFLATGRYPSVEVATYLIQSGRANVGAVTKTGATALHGAALQGNLECVQLLLKHGADPRIEDEDGTTPFDLSKDDKIRTILHESLIDMDSKKDSADAVCTQCKKPSADVLKHCAQCHVTVYCSRECQVKHWKVGGHREACSGFVMARPTVEGNGKEEFQTSFYKVMGSDTKNVKVFSRKASEAADRMQFLRNKRFVVKVQLPIGLGGQGQMMVYNADRTVEGFIYSTEKGYSVLAHKIRSEGFMGIKGFFWAELTGLADGTFKVFHGKLAPYQSW